jgi:hypothetical protein
MAGSPFVINGDRNPMFQELYLARTLSQPRERSDRAAGSYYFLFWGAKI